MTEQTLIDVAELAQRLSMTPSYINTRCRRREWPHRRGPKGAPRFTAEDVAAIVELMAVPVETPATPRISFAPRSRRGAA